MRRISLCLALAAALISSASVAAGAPAAAARPAVEARAYFVENPRTHEILASSHAYESLPIASITKLMSVHVALQHLRPDDVVTVSRSAANVGESTIHLDAGDRLTVRDLVLAALVQSANDAADALADGASGGDRALFIGWMNDEARALGMVGTHFARPDGLDWPGHVSTARDVTLLARVAMRDPLVRSAVDMRTVRITGDRMLHTWDDLLGVFPGLYGVKTGHTDNAGWCQVAVVRRPGITLFATVLGDPTRGRRNADLTALLRFGLSRYRLATVLDPEAVLAHIPTDYGRAPIELGVSRPLRASVRVDRPLVERLLVPTRLALPVVRGQHVGEIRLYSNGRLVGTRSLIVSRSVPRPGMLGRARWYAGRTVHKLLGWL
ncbi:MAG: D-alanyl-D-alanine carboxypeptidase family protein [Gaiellaceae bacterium]